jgi:hypothetical protein
MNIDRLLAAYLSDGNFRLNHRDLLAFEKAAILGDWQCYKSERNKTVANLLSFPKHFENSPLMGLRILERLYDLRTDSQAPNKGFESLEELIAYFKAMSVPAQITDKTILELVNARLIEPYNLSVLAEHGLKATERIESVALSDSGRLLRYWARKSAIYGLEMIQDMVIYDEVNYNELLEAHINRFDGFVKRNFSQVKDAELKLNVLSRNYLSARDKEFVHIPSDALFASQMRLENVLLNWSSADDDIDLV